MALRRALNRWRRQLYDSWLKRRLPRVDQICLGRKSIFTFPSMTGLAFLVFLAVIWLLAINYENNVVFAFGALLGAALVVSIFHGYGNLSGLTLRITAIEDGFPGDRLRVTVEIEQSGKRHRDDIWLSFPGGMAQRVVLHDSDSSVQAGLFITAWQRGWLHTERLTVESAYPLGLIRVWTHVLLSGAGVVYPRPVEGQPEVATARSGADDRTVETIAGSEDFSELRSYREGEPFNRIAWKQVARGQGIYTKHFVDTVADPQWLEWDNYPGMDREARLSRLCGAVLDAAASVRPFGLKLPGTESELGQGDAHKHRLLRMLALFEAGERL